MHEAVSMSSCKSKKSLLRCFFLLLLFLNEEILTVKGVQHMLAGHSSQIKDSVKF